MPAPRSRRASVAVLSCLLFITVAHPASQSKPDFSGTWTEIDVADGAAPVVLTVTQDANTLTVVRSPTQKWTLKLDGSRSANVTAQGERMVAIISTATWDGPRLVVLTPLQSNGEGAYTIRQVWILDGPNLVVTNTEINDTTKMVVRQFAQKFRK